VAVWYRDVFDRYWVRRRIDPQATEVSRAVIDPGQQSGDAELPAADVSAR
jgi:hypothetical protein